MENTELNDHELLMELVEEKRRSEKMNNLKFYLVIAFVIAMAVMVYYFLNRIYTTVASYGAVMSQVEAMAGQVCDLDHDFEWQLGSSLFIPDKGMNVDAKLLGKDEEQDHRDRSGRLSVRLCCL